MGGPNEPIIPRYLSIREAATYMGISPTHVHRLANVGRLRWIDVGTCRRPTKRIDRLSIDALTKLHEGELVKPQERRGGRGIRVRKITLIAPF